MSFINDYIKPSDFGSNRKDINRILALIHNIVAQEPEDEALKQRILVANHLKIRTTTVVFGAPDVSNTDIRNRETFNWRRKKPTGSKTYDLVHTQVGAGALTFPVSDTKFGARCDFDGINYITIDDEPRLKPTNAITIVGWFYLKKTGNLQELLKMQNSNPPYEIRIKSNNDLRFRINVDGTIHDKDISAANWNVDTWYHLVITWSGTPDNRYRVYIDKVQQGLDIVTSGTMTYSGSDGLGIGAQPSGNSPLANGSRIALFSILNVEVNQTWINNHFGGLLDTSDGNDEITTIEFISDDAATPDAIINLFKAS